ncbi:hypothetical protein FC093_18305 [Ilyomonas limi]|uniref:Uncharacterized protein n=1 Tax=Ilyomonas limi TaxID=2575867 RepID=A0A4U3KXW4_9BACT|nr:hypothetical protein [Ilyomonas limi]TKK65957.1 hypothetical protein FC093_18305 [Ilyomonas limi]
MTDPTTNAEVILNKVSRRYLLRNAAIAATGVVLLPPFITGCSKDGDAPGGGVGSVGGVQLTPEQLEQAADNLRRMRTWITELYPLCIEYEDAVFHALKSTKENPNWTNFIVDAFIDIATALAAAAAIAEGAGPAVPAFAFLSSILHDWGIGKDVPENLDEVFADFEFGHVKMQLAIEQQLSHLVDPTNNYNNLTTAWTEPIEFNGSTYTIGNLATSYFPDLGDNYNTLQSAALISFEKSVWNLAIMKCCTLGDVSDWYIYLYNEPNDNYPHTSVVEYAQTEMYPQNKAHYLRGGYYDQNDDYRTIRLHSWRLGINGSDFPEEAVNRLFMDDTPGHIINPDGLFTRDYVFTQFALTKPFWIADWQLLSDKPNGDFCDECSTDWNFTGGVFPELTH